MVVVFLLLLALLDRAHEQAEEVRQSQLPVVAVDFRRAQPHECRHTVARFPALVSRLLIATSVPAAAEFSGMNEKKNRKFAKQMGNKTKDMFMKNSPKLKWER